MADLDGTAQIGAHGNWSGATPRTKLRAALNRAWIMPGDRRAGTYLVTNSPPGPSMSKGASESPVGLGVTISVLTVASFLRPAVRWTAAGAGAAGRHERGFDAPPIADQRGTGSAQGSPQWPTCPPTPGSRCVRVPLGPGSIGSSSARTIQKDPSCSVHDSQLIATPQGPNLVFLRAIFPEQAQRP